MKFREKSFIILFAIFIAVFNISMFFVLHFTYQEELSSIKSRAIGEAYFIRTSIVDDFANLEASMNLTYDSREKLFLAYSNYYRKNGIFLEFWKGTSLEYSNLPAFQAERRELNLEDEIQNILIRTINGKKYLFVASNLSDPYQEYSLVYTYDLHDLKQNQARLIQLLVRVDIGVIVALAVILYCVMYRLMRPLSVLSLATQKIAQGNYDTFIQIKGKDEFADLGDQFNKMAKQLKLNIEELKEEADQKQHLIDNMAHELRTPLTSIGGYADYLRMAETTEDERFQALDYIVSESQRLARLSKAILYMAEVREDGLQDAKEIPIEHLVSNLKGLFHTCQLSIQYSVEAEVIFGNEEMIFSLLSNLIENAIRASKEEGTIQVTFAQKEQLEIKIADEGVGMSPEEIIKIEEPFYRVDKARSRKSGGVGLGVSLCRQIVTAHNATMTYTSEKGKGTTVTLLWPVKTFTT